MKKIIYEIRYIITLKLLYWVFKIMPDSREKTELALSLGQFFVFAANRIKKRLKQ